MKKLQMFLIGSIVAVLMACGDDAPETEMTTTGDDKAATEQTTEAKTNDATASKEDALKTTKVDFPKECEALIKKSEKMRNKMAKKSQELIEVMPEADREMAQANLDQQMELFTIDDAKEELQKDLETRGVEEVTAECILVSSKLDEMEGQLLEALEIQKKAFIDQQKETDKE